VDSQHDINMNRGVSMYMLMQSSTSSGASSYLGYAAF